VATPASGYLFVNWAGDVSTIANVNAATTTITMNDDYEITARFTAVVGSKTETVTNGTVDARDEADTEVLVSGNATVAVAQFVDNPGGGSPTGFNSLGKYIDVHIPDVGQVTETDIRLYYTPSEVPAGVDETSLKLFWWNGIAWVQCSDSGVNTTDHYVWAKIRTEGTTPTLAQLTGTPFAGYSSPPPHLIISSTAGGNVTTPGEGTFTYDAGTVVNLVATPTAGYRFVNWTGNVGTIANVTAASTTITMNGNYSITANFVAVYNLTISTTAGGTVTTPGVGTFIRDAGTVVNLVATPAAGYRFDNWTGDVGTIANVSAAATNITMNGNYSITANFVRQYNLTITSTAGGTVTTSGVGNFTYDVGTVVNLVATPASHYRFVNWTGNVGTIANVNAATTTITMNSAYNIYANFARVPQNYLYTYTSTGGTVTTPGMGGWFAYDEGTVVNLVATPDDGYVFTYWGGNVSTIANVNAASTTITMNGEDALYQIWPCFAKQQYNLTISSTAGGTVNTPGDGTFTYDAGTVVDLMATPAGYRFVNWTGDVDTVANVTAATTTITMNGNYSITANFVKQYDLYVDSTAGGNVTTPGVGPFTYDAGTVVNLVATPAAGYRFVAWEYDVGTIANVTAANTTITMNGDYYISANFATLPVDYLYITSNAGGTVTTPGMGGWFTYDEGTVVNLVATPDAGYAFDYWWGNVSTIADVNAANTTITMNGEGVGYYIYAIFAHARNLTVSSTEGGSVTTPGEGTFTYPQETWVNLVATPAAGYRFGYWTGDVGTILNVNGGNTSIYVWDNYSITANFIKQYNLTISSTAGGTVTTPGVGTFTRDAGTVVSLVATPAADYRFVNWTGDVVTIANANAASTTITMNADYSATANFETLPEYDLTISSTAGGSVTTPGEGTFTRYEGTVVNLVATPTAGYAFANWTGDVDTIANVNAATTTITINGGYSIMANFVVGYNLTISSTAGGSVTTPGEGTFTYAPNRVVIMVAKPEAGCHFVNWTGDVGTIANVNAAITGITMYDNYSITANFEPGYTPMVAAGELLTVGLKADGTVVATGWNYWGQCDVGGWTDITQVAAGDEYTVGLKSDGTVVATGWNYYGQCDVGGWTNIVQVAAGWEHTVGLKADRTVVAVGDNDHGQCNVSGWTNITEVSAGSDHTVGLKSDGTVVAVGWNNHGQCSPVSGWTNITQVAAGGYHTVGLKSNGTVVAVGQNDYGQCNVSGWTNITQVAAGGYYTVGLEADGTVVAVGHNPYGQCDVGNWTDIVQVAAGAYHTVGLKSDGTVVVTGDNNYGQCNVSGWTDITQVAAGGYHTVGLNSDGAVVAVGDNSYGQCYVDGCWMLN
jgi:alpha-tubulin suppressor-like RCC1 family protein